MRMFLVLSFERSKLHIHPPNPAFERILHVRSHGAFPNDSSPGMLIPGSNSVGAGGAHLKVVSRVSP